MLFYTIGTIWIIMYMVLGFMLLWAGMKFLLRKTVDCARKSAVSDDVAIKEISFKNANSKCFIRKVFSQPSIECFEHIAIFCSLMLAFILFEFSWGVLIAALLCFVTIALSLHLLYRIISNFSNYKDKALRSKNAALVVKYAVMTWEAGTPNDIVSIENAFREERLKYTK